MLRRDVVQELSQGHAILGTDLLVMLFCKGGRHSNGGHTRRQQALALCKALAAGVTVAAAKNRLSNELIRNFNGMLCSYVKWKLYGLACGITAIQQCLPSQHHRAKDVERMRLPSKELY